VAGRRSRDTAGLARLRVRLTAVFAAAATMILVLFVLLLLLTSTRLERRRQDATLTGAASRATALIYDDDGGHVRVEGVKDDQLASGGPLLVADTAGHVLLTTGEPADRAASLALAAQAVHSPGKAAVDTPIFGTITVDGRPRRAVTMAWTHGDDDRIAGAVVVVATGPVELGTSELLLPAAGGGAAVLALLVTMTWVLAGRSLRPAAATLAEREAFLSTAAHELRGPLARLRAGAEAARRSVRPGDPAGAAIAHLVTIADGAAHVVSNLLLATRAERGEVPVLRRPVDLSVLAGELELTVASVVVDVVEPVVVDGDPALLRHALANLVDNAIRHGRVGDALPLVEVQVRARGGEAVLRVTDDGPGFPPDVDVLARFTAGARTGGTGLGLPLVAWIVERHGGTMRLSSGNPYGACIELHLPRPAVPTPTSRRDHAIRDDHALRSR